MRVATKRSQLLVQLEQCMVNTLLVEEGDVASDGIGAWGNSSHFRQRQPAGFEQGGLFSVFFDQRCCEGRREHLRNVADPGAELIVLVRIEDGNRNAQLLQPRKIFRSYPGSERLSRPRSQEPDCSTNKIRLRKLDPLTFLS